jgi:N-acetyl-anhydromuramyl-L-alanine amidase AmpD
MNIIDVRESIPKSNYSREIIKPEGFTFHISASTSIGSILSHFRNPQSQVSYNDVFDTNGDVYLVVSSNRRAYHNGNIRQPTAQIVKDHGSKNPNSYMIGMSAVSAGGDLTDEQYNSICKRTIELASVYNIKLDRYHMIGHGEVDTVTRRFDPILSYTVNEIITRIKLMQLDEKYRAAEIRYKNHIEELENRIEVNNADIKELDYHLDLKNNDICNMSKEIDRLQRIIKKNRTYTQKIKDFYKETIQRLRGQ